MTIHEPDIAPAPTGDPTIIDTLRNMYAAAMTEADRLASIGGHEREIAQQHLIRAAEADAAAMSARAYAERWRRHLEYELAGPADTTGQIEPPAAGPEPHEPATS
ncbi:hypothetical protein E1286_24135 [Nonomuraea terrae]|uniref:Uncharacterized protein n=1 Tax=Nonomuraea terrae TaxID=2530383 RepID=A0A4R4YLU4_9ACTN|nr:hypothetical protein [Nonomuraea terrae]TDD45410.1 hypothetical protein E1286_24135 [Nonomuraea terrae]